jgi:hypothetical protein
MPARSVQKRHRFSTNIIRKCHKIRISEAIVDVIHEGKIRAPAAAMALIERSKKASGE